MGKMVEAVRLGYYGNARRRVGEQFIMAESDFHKPVLDKDGKPVLDDKGQPKLGEESTPSWVVIVEDGYEDPIVEREADSKKMKAVKRQPAKAMKDDHRQGGAFDVHPETGIQVTGQVAPARPAASSAHESTLVPQDAKPAKKGSGDKSVI